MCFQEENAVRRGESGRSGEQKHCPSQQIETAAHCDTGTTGCMQNAFWVKSPCGAVRDEIEFSRGWEDPEEKPRTNLFI